MHGRSKRVDRGAQALRSQRGENRPGYLIALFSTPERKYCLQAEIPFSCQVQKSVYPLQTLYTRKPLCHTKAPHHPRMTTQPNPSNNPFKRIARSFSLNLASTKTSLKNGSAPVEENMRIGEIKTGWTCLKIHSQLH